MSFLPMLSDKHLKAVRQSKVGWVLITLQLDTEPIIWHVVSKVYYHRTRQLIIILYDIPLTRRTCGRRLWYRRQPRPNDKYLNIRYWKHDDKIKFKKNVILFLLALCGGPLPLPSGSFRSPGYPGNYPDDVKCIWTITVPPGSTLELEFRFFETEKW